MKHKQRRNILTMNSVRDSKKKDEETSQLGYMVVYG